MTTEYARVAVVLSGMLGQSFGFLFGQPKQMFTAEIYHGSLCSVARRSGFLKVDKENRISFRDVEALDNQSLQQKWQEWGHYEMLRR